LPVSLFCVTSRRYDFGVDDVKDRTARLEVFPSCSRTPTAAELLEQIHIGELTMQLDTDRLLRSPVPCVLDTEFFYSAFQSQLEYGGAPRTLQAAMEGQIRLFMAEETFAELVDKKLAEFAIHLGTTTGVLETFLKQYWLDWLNLVELPDESTDPRVAAVVVRDASDRPAACLSSLLAPCVLLTNDTDFAALLGVVESVRHVVVVRAAVALGGATVQLQTMTVLPALPVIGTANGARWVANRIGLSPWILGGVIVLVCVWAYRRQDDETRAMLRRAASEVGYQYLRSLGVIQDKVTVARTTLNKRLVLPSGNRTCEQVILRKLAVADEALSARKLWEGLDPGRRPGVDTVREFLRSHPSAQGFKGGVWTLGYRLCASRNEPGTADAVDAPSEINAVDDGA
jgi:hypothetical protein